MCSRRNSLSLKYNQVRTKTYSGKVTSISQANKSLCSSSAALMPKFTKASLCSTRTLTLVPELTKMFSRIQPVEEQTPRPTLELAGVTSFIKMTDQVLSSTRQTTTFTKQRTGRLPSVLSEQPRKSLHRSILTSNSTPQGLEATRLTLSCRRSSRPKRSEARRDWCVHKPPPASSVRHQHALWMTVQPRTRRTTGQRWASTSQGASCSNH